MEICRQTYFYGGKDLCSSVGKIPTLSVGKLKVPPEGMGVGLVSHHLVLMLLVLVLLVLMGWEIYGKIKQQRWIFYGESIQNNIFNIICIKEACFVTFSYKINFPLAH